MMNSSLLLTAATSRLVVVDMQEKLVPAIPGSDRLIWNVSRLIRGAKLFDVPTLGTEQYPAGLGPTVPQLAADLTILPGKLSFSCVGGDGFAEAMASRAGNQVLLAGIETHVCVLQTALDLTAAGFQVFLALDATGARGELDYATAVRRMESVGVTLATTESVLFEWCRVAGSERFKEISRLVREVFPGG